MVSNRELGKRATPAAGPLLERVRKALAHDLRTPLGTIGNYATILEYHDQAKPEEVRAFAERIRSSTVRLSAMLTSLADALALATRPSTEKGAEPAAILRSLLSELGLQGRFPAHGAEPRACGEVDPELLRFCWRAFLGIQFHAKSANGLDLDVSCCEESGVVTVDLSFGHPSEREADERIECAAYTQLHNESAAQDACFALSLAENLVLARGGSFEILGRDGVAGQLRLRMPNRS